MARFRDIPQLPRAHYEVHIAWRSLETSLESWNETAGGEFGGIDMNPEYQRGHVWSREQQISYVEYILRGGEVGMNITWNSPDWASDFKRPTELVDGKQRLEAARAFLRDEFPAFGTLCTKYEDRMGPMDPRFAFRVCRLETREEVLQLYLNINAGGTPHTDQELDLVRDMLNEARTK